MSERDAVNINDIIQQLHELLREAQYPAMAVLDYIDRAAETERKDRALKRAAHQAQELFESVVSAACAAGNLLTELEEVKTW